MANELTLEYFGGNTWPSGIQVMVQLKRRASTLAILRKGFYTDN